jgi:hypothetical protein
MLTCTGFSHPEGDGVTIWPVHMLLTAWDDLDRALDGITEYDATRQMRGCSAFAWTLAHVTAGVESWINGRFQGLPLEPLIMHERFRFGGTGVAADWHDIHAAVLAARQRAQGYVIDISDEDLELTLPYDGSHSAFREHGIQVREAILQNAVHHQYHVGKIVTKRELMGHAPGMFPGNVTGRTNTDAAWS